MTKLSWPWNGLLSPTAHCGFSAASLVFLLYFQYSQVRAFEKKNAGVINLTSIPLENDIHSLLNEAIHLALAPSLPTANCSKTWLLSITILCDSKVPLSYLSLRIQDIVRILDRAIGGRYGNNSSEISEVGLKVRNYDFKFINI